MWSQPLDCEDKTVVSEIGEQWSPKMAPAKTLAMMAVDLLADDAGTGRRVLDEFTPGMSRDEYLARQEGIFRTELFDGAA